MEMGRGAANESGIEAGRRTSLADVHWRGIVRYDYERRINGAEHAQWCDGICRCQVIEQVRIEGLNTEQAVKAIWPTAEPLTAYALERLLRTQALWEPQHWQPEIIKGYYGEEVGQIRLDWQKAAAIEAEAETLLALPANEQIERTLVLEYGYLLDELQGRDWTLRQIATEELVLGAEEHYRSLDTAAIERYRYRRELPVALVIPRPDGRYRVIDGYHRAAAALRDEREQVPVVVGEKR